MGTYFVCLAPAFLVLAIALNVFESRRRAVLTPSEREAEDDDPDPEHKIW